MKRLDFKDLKNLKGAATDNPLAREEKTLPVEPDTAPQPAPVETGPRTRISVDVDKATLKKLNAITMDRQLASGDIIPRASVVRDLLQESIDRHYQTKDAK